MTQDELIELLRKHEWRDVEFKEARRKVPRDAYETVSAFANTEGGHLVFGVRKSGQEMEIVGVLDVDKVQNEFLSTLRQPDKISVVVDVEEDLHRHDESDLLVFYVPEAHRSQKPVFLNGDIRRAFVRSGGSDVRCSDQERNGFLIDAAAERPDGRAVDLNPATAFDTDAIRWYRAVYEARPGNRSCAALSDVEFQAVIRHYADQTVFWNPGDAFAADVDLLEPSEREVRNPRIVLAFRRIGLSEHAGWGLRDVFRNWQQLGYVPPLILSDRRRRSFELVLKREELLSERQVAFQQRLGLRLMDEQARAFSLACREQDVRLWQIKAVTGLSGPESVALAEQLVDLTLIERVSADRYVLARHLRDRLVESDQVSDQVGAESGDMVTDQVSPSRTSMFTGRATRQLTAHQRRIIDACDVPRSLVDLMQRAGVTHRTFFRRRHLQPLVDSGIVRMTNPDNQNAADQRYVLTEVGAAIKAARIRRERENDGGGHG